MYSVQISIIRDLVYGAVSHGASLNALCQRMGIAAATLNDAENHLPWETASAFWPLAAELTSDPQLGLHMGHDVSHSAVGMLGRLAQSCKTLEEAIAAIVKYNNALSSVFQYSLHVTDEFGYIGFEPLPVYETRYAESARQATEVSMSSFVRMFGMVTGKKIAPVAVELTYPQRAVEEYENILKAPVTFNATRSCLVVRRKDLQTPIISYDKSLFALFDTILANKQKSLTEDTSLRERIRRMVLFTFKGQVPAIEIIASQLALTTRTLQRKLAEENTSYRDIANQLRKELTTEMLSNNLKKEQIATLLGYSDASTLRRKYRRWMRTEAVLAE